MTHHRSIQNMMRSIEDEFFYFYYYIFLKDSNPTHQGNNACVVGDFTNI